MVYLFKIVFFFPKIDVGLLLIHFCNIVCIVVSSVVVLLLIGFISNIIE